jgi:hypothetical protein
MTEFADVFDMKETAPISPDWMVEQRGFEPLTSAVDVRAVRTPSLQGLALPGARFGILS